MKRRILRLVIPHEENQYHPYLLRHQALTTLLVILLTSQLTLNFFYSTNLRILGFATSIYQNEIVTLTNQEREKSKLPPLFENPILDRAAKLKAADMFTKDYWAHIAPDGVTPWHWFEKSGYNYLAAGENLAKDFNTSTGVVTAWMNSPTHRENILNGSFSEIGVTILNGKLAGEETTLVVQFFGRPQLATVAGTEPPQGSAPALTTAPASTSVVSGLTQIQPLQNPTVSLAATEELRLKILGSLDWETWGLGQKVTFSLISALIFLFLLDSFILWRKGLLHLRRNSHSLLHASSLLILIIGVALSNGGMVI